MMKILFYLALLSIFLIHCEKDYAPIPNRENNQNPKTYIPLEVHPDSGRVGDVLQISGMNFQSKYSILLLFNHKYYYKPDSIMDNKLFIDIPFEGIYDSLLIWKYFSPETIGVISDFNFISECDTDEICLLPYNLNVPLTAHQAMQTGGGLKEWSADKSNDTVTVVRSFPTFVELAITQRCVFKSLGNNLLPELIDCYFIEHQDFGRNDTLTLYAVIIKIQDWHTTGIVSGRVIGRARTKSKQISGQADFAFWYDFTNKIIK
jgi:hypothetical protein